MGLYYNLTQRSSSPRGMSHNGVRSICDDRDGVLRTGAWGEGARANLFRSAREAQQTLMAEVHASVGDASCFGDIAVMVALRDPAPE
jgi:hypothetical protein